MSSARIELLTIVEVSNLLKVPVKTLRQWIYRRQIPHLKLNGVVRFQRAEIEAWIGQSFRPDSSSKLTKGQENDI